MNRFDKACIVAVLLSAPLLWRLSPGLPQYSEADAVTVEDAWQSPERPAKKNLEKIRDKVSTAPALGFVPPAPGVQPGEVQKRPAFFYGTFQAGTVLSALLENGNTIRLCRQGDTLPDGTTVLKISLNSVSLQLQDGAKKKIVLYEESP